MTSKGPKPGSKLEQLGAVLAGKMKLASFRRPSLAQQEQQERKEKQEQQEQEEQKAAKFTRPLDQIIVEEDEKQD